MKRTFFRLICLLLVCALLSGCGLDLSRYTDALNGLGSSNSSDITPYSEMVYTRPDMEALEATLAKSCEAAAGTDLPRIIQSIYNFYDAYDLFYTNYSLADIRYSCDLTDSYWEAECNFCAENSPRVDAMLEELYYALAQSPCLAQLESEKYFGAGYFDSYQGENNWDEAFTAMLETQSSLISRYYALAGIGAEFESASEEYFNACYEGMAQVLVELIALRQDMAAYWGYEDYNQFAYDFYYYRDYDVADTRSYLTQIRETLVDLYTQMNHSNIWDFAFPSASELDTYAYVERTAKAMGGMVEEAFLAMDQAGLYDISYGPNKYPSSFEVYLTSYYVPFVFMCPSMTTYDYLVFAHEFGHFCNDYASYGSYAGVDVLEFFSQGMEYLSLCYGNDSGHLTKMKMADSLCMYVEQAAYAEFELRMYDIPQDELTTDALLALYQEVADSYGFESFGYDPREFVTVNHYYTNPLYIISYVVSNDAAMQLYQLEQESSGAGLACFEENLTTGEYYFLSFLNSADLESPFAEGRIRKVREIFETILG